MAKSTTYTPAADQRIVVFHGKEELLREERTKALLAKLEESHGGVAVFRFDGEQAQLAEVLDELRSYGLMESYKMVILDAADRFLAPPRDDDASGGKGENRIRRTLERYAENPVDHATLVLRAESWRPGNLDKLVKKVGDVVKCDVLTDAVATKWCIDRARKQHGVTLERPAATLLVERMGTGLGRLENEIAKLAALVAADQTITPAIVKEMVGLSREEKAWEVQSAVLTGRAGVALQKIDEMIEVSRTPDVLLMWSLLDLARKLHGTARQLQDGVSAGGVIKSMQLWGDARDVVLRAARRHPAQRFARLLRDGVRADRQVKSGLATSRASIERLAVQLADIVQ